MMTSGDCVNCVTVNNSKCSGHSSKCMFSSVWIGLGLNLYKGHLEGSWTGSSALLLCRVRK